MGHHYDHSGVRKKKTPEIGIGNLILVEKGMRVAKTHKKKSFGYWITFGCLATLSLFVFMLFHRSHALLEPRSLKELLALPDKDLGRVDIARMNLICAEGLPNSGGIDIEQSLATIDRWAETTKQAERKYLPNYYKTPWKYENSVSKFKAITLALTVKEDLKCGYNMELVRSGAMSDMRSTRFFSDSRDLFLHGFIARKTGTCASLPVLIVALGRRCGYPLKLVSSKGHLFCRWEDGREIFNLEVSMQGVDIYPDSYYRTFPKAFTDAERLEEKYLKSFTAVEELSLFMSIRATFLRENGRFSDSVSAYEASLRGFPESRQTRKYIQDVKFRDALAGGYKRE
jgi:hypothetical protein